MTQLNANIHPPTGELALCARRDLPRLRQWQVNRHLARCADCANQVNRFRLAANETRRISELTTDAALEVAFDWSRLQREMAGNISVGIAAAQCIGSARRKAAKGWRIGAMATVLTLVFVFGWLYNIPHEDTERIAGALRTVFSKTTMARGTLLQTNTRGVSVRSAGGSLTILRPDSAKATESFTGNGSVGVRYVDDETGQVTITNVYGQ